jgi:hypothetical protein
MTTSDDEQLNNQLAFVLPMSGTSGNMTEANVTPFRFLSPSRDRQKIVRL